MGNLYHKFISFIKSPNGSKILIAVGIVIILAAIPLTVWFTQQQQTVQQHAEFLSQSADSFEKQYSGASDALYGWTNNGYTKVSSSGGYISLYICDVKDWNNALLYGCNNVRYTPSVKKILINRTGACSVNCDQFYKKIGVGEANGYLNINGSSDYLNIFPDKKSTSTCIIWQEDVGGGSTAWHSYGNRTNCALPPPTNTNTPVPTRIPPTPTQTPSIPTATFTPTPTVTPINTPTLTPTPKPTITPTPTLTPTPSPTVTGTPPPTPTPTVTPINTPTLTPPPTPNAPLVINRQQPTQPPLPTSAPIPTQVPTGNTLQTIELISIGSLLILIGGILILL